MLELLGLTLATGRHAVASTLSTVTSVNDWLLFFRDDRGAQRGWSNAAMRPAGNQSLRTRRKSPICSGDCLGLVAGLQAFPLPRLVDGKELAQVGR